MHGHFFFLHITIGGEDGIAFANSFVFADAGVLDDPGVVDGFAAIAIDFVNTCTVHKCRCCEMREIVFLRSLKSLGLSHFWVVEKV